MFDDFYATAHELIGQGVPFVTATVIRAEKPTSGKPGDKAIVTADGVMHGWIGGSCAQPTVIKEALKALASDESRLVRLSMNPEEQAPREGVEDLPMTCYSGGTLEIYIEPHRPRPRLLIVGDLPVAQALAHLGSAMNYQVIVVSLAGKSQGVPHADKTIEGLDGVADHIQPFTYVVVATHGSHDEVALLKILKASPTYVGLVASPRRARAVREYLQVRGVTEAELLTLKAPAGLDIQARRGDEIALSIMAEIVQHRRNAEEIELALFRSPQKEESLPEAAIDPVCHMEVEIAGAAYTAEHQGAAFYFCCAGCQEKFEKNQAAYLQAEVRSGE